MISLGRVTLSSGFAQLCSSVSERLNRHVFNMPPSNTLAVLFQELGAYNVSKTALLGLTRTLALELASKNIRVNCLVPGIIDTDFSKVVRTGCPQADSMAEGLTVF